MHTHAQHTRRGDSTCPSIIIDLMFLSKGISRWKTAWWELWFSWLDVDFITYEITFLISHLHYTQLIYLLCLSNFWFSLIEQPMKEYENTSWARLAIFVVTSHVSYSFVSFLSIFSSVLLLNDATYSSKNTRVQNWNLKKKMKHTQRVVSTGWAWSTWAFVWCYPLWMAVRELRGSTRPIPNPVRKLLPCRYQWPLKHN